LLLQSVGTALRPSFSRLLEPGEGYNGGESFFEAEHLEGPKPPLVYVDARESASLASASEAPEGLQQAIAFFLVAAAAQAASDPSVLNLGQNFLCHTSHLRINHRHLETLIRAYVDKVSNDLERGQGAAITRLHSAHAELCRTHTPSPIAEILEQVVAASFGVRSWSSTPRPTRNTAAA
jgi:hypothetical protein